MTHQDQAPLSSPDPADSRIQLRGPGRTAPARAPGSVRRTMSIDMHWADGPGSSLFIDGRARDLATTTRGDGIVASQGTVEVEIAPDRTITALSANPNRVGIEQLIGAGSIGGFRRALATAAPGSAEVTPIDQLLDDIPGATVISDFAFTQWRSAEGAVALQARGAGPRRRVEGVCAGFRPGSSGLAPDGGSSPVHRTRKVDALDSTGDPLAWHALPAVSGVSMRRARRIDVWLDGKVCRVDALFQDSASRPDGGRVAVHEYRMEAAVDLRSMVLLAIDAEPRVLPYAECPLAVHNIHQMIGVSVSDLPLTVLKRLRGVAGCTHLNDALRALAGVPYLLNHLRDSP